MQASFNQFFSTLKEHTQQQGDSTAWNIFYTGSWHRLPWWVLENKIKHFALGLLHGGAQPGDYFYLLPLAHPHWAFAELAALSLKLITVPLPASLQDEEIEKLVTQYPPSFFFFSQSHGNRLSKILKTTKKIKCCLLGFGNLENWELGSPIQTFREIFNQGIIYESQHHKHYRSLRDNIPASQTMSTMSWNSYQGLRHENLKYSKFNEWMKNLDQENNLPKRRRLVAQSDWSDTMDRWTTLYWPLLKGISCTHHPDKQEILNTLKLSQANIAYLKTNVLEGITHIYARKPEEENKEESKWTQYFPQIFKSKKQKIFGKKLKQILTPQNPAKDAQDFLEKNKMRYKVLSNPFVSRA